MIYTKFTKKTNFTFWCEFLFARCKGLRNRDILVCGNWNPGSFKWIPETYNRRQNELRHFALNGLFDVFRTSKGEKIAFPPPSPPCNVMPLFELPLENKKHPNFEWRGQGRGVDSYASEVTLFEYNVSTILSPIVGFGIRNTLELKESGIPLTIKIGNPSSTDKETGFQ